MCEKEEEFWEIVNSNGEAAVLAAFFTEDWYEDLEDFGDIIKKK